MASHGKIGEFNTESDDWELYAERMKFYFEAHGITNADKRRAILLTAMGNKSYKLLRSLVAPEPLNEQSYDELVKVMKDHQKPTPSVIVQRHKFDTRDRKPNESVAEFLANLREIAQYCEFSTSLEERLRDRLVSGIRNDRIQRRLLTESTLTFNEAHKIAVAMELAEKNSEVLKAGQVPSEGDNTSSVDKLAEETKRRECFRCGGSHRSDECKFVDAWCFNCNKKGHIARKCRSGSNRPNQRRASRWQNDEKVEGNSRNNQQYRSANRLEQDEAKASQDYEMYELREEKAEPINVVVEINNQELSMEVDTGAAVSVMGSDTWKRLTKSGVKLQPSNIILKTYTGEKVQVKGESKVQVKYNEKSYDLPIVVVEGRTRTLLGRNWLRDVKLNWEQIFSMSVADKVDEWADKYPKVFQSGLGTLQGTEARIYVDKDAKPIYCKARPVPYLLKSKIENKLQKLIDEGTIEPVQYSEWAAPIVPIVKEDGSVRICGDYKMTVNKVSKLDNYPIPKCEDLFATLNGGQQFTKLDMSQAYQQLKLDEQSKQYTTINTHKGLFRYNRLPYGISSAPGIYQRVMENLLQGLPQVIVRVDDILISGKNEEAHRQNLEEVLRRLSDAGLRLNSKKCVFMAEEVVYLGQKISKEGVQPIKDKVKAVTDAPAPKNVAQLRAYLGMLNYYHRFIPNLASELQPLYKLLKKSQAWMWGQQQQQTFEKSKEMLKSSKLLVHYDSKKEILLQCDASPYGIGAVLSHKMEDGSDRPIAYASRTLAPAEKNYSQLEKEALAIIFGLGKFHQYVYGTKFTILTDHKPLEGLFNEEKGIPVTAAERIRRWALTLSAYEYKIKYKAGSEHGNADGLSRIPVKETVSQVPRVGSIDFSLSYLDSTPITSARIKDSTRRDPEMSLVMRYIESGWTCKTSETMPESLKPYYNRRQELTVEDGCILWGQRVVIPQRHRQSMVDEIHTGHPGICRMKAIARSIIWWPKMDADLEAKVKTCEECQVNQKTPAEAPLHPWEFPHKPWSRLHIDFAGPFCGKMLLIIVDAYSKWIDVHIMQTSTSAATIEKLRATFSTHGLPEIIVSDNGSNFTSEEFETFLKLNGIKHIKTAPYHPASNGLAERAVQTVKEGIKKQNGNSMQTKVNRFLFQYRITPHTTTGQTPAELLMNRKLKSRLDLVRPDVTRTVRGKQENQKQQHDRHVRERKFKAEDPVYIKNYGQGNKWIPARIIEKTGPVSYTAMSDDGKRTRRHQDQILNRKVQEQNEDQRKLGEERDTELERNPEAPPLAKASSTRLNEAESEKTEQNETDSTSCLPVRIRTRTNYYGY